MPSVGREEIHSVTLPSPATGHIVEVFEDDPPSALRDDPTTEMYRLVLSRVLAVVRGVVRAPIEGKG